MAVNLLNFPLGLVVDGILSFIQYRFANPAITPDAYRWDSDDKKSRIRISGQYSIDNAKPGSIPSITVRRSGMQFAFRGMDNLEKADPNTFENATYQDWLDGFIEILCESTSPSESSTLANYLAIEFQANRHDIIDTLGFVRHLSYLDVGPEMLVEKTVEPRRFQVMLRLKASVYLGWIKRSEDTIPFDKIEIKDIDEKQTWNSSSGDIEKGNTYLIDLTADFGYLLTNNPQLLQAELEKKWYYVAFKNDNRLYQVEEIKDNHTIKLSDKDKDDQIVPFNPSTSQTGVSYKILWNSVHIDIKIPNNS